jgi:hypothetical protein
MMNPMTDNDDEIYLKKDGIDRSVGYLIAGIVVLLFFLLTILGMGRIHTMSDATTTHRFVPEEKVSEIGNAEPAGAKD